MPYYFLVNLNLMNFHNFHTPFLKYRQIVQLESCVFLYLNNNITKYALFCPCFPTVVRQFTRHNCHFSRRAFSFVYRIKNHRFLYCSLFKAFMIQRICKIRFEVAFSEVHANSDKIHLWVRKRNYWKHLASVIASPRISSS